MKVEDINGVMMRGGAVKKKSNGKIYVISSCSLENIFFRKFRGNTLGKVRCIEKNEFCKKFDKY